MAKDNTDYVEKDRMPISEKTDVVISEVWTDGKMTGILINEFIRTPKYTGPTKGAFIPKDQWPEFIAKVSHLYY